MPKRFSRPPRYDHFDIPPYMNCRSADFIGYSIFLEIFLEMRFCDVSEVPEKSVFTRLFCVFATVVLANFQDRLVMTTSHTPPEDRQARLSGAGRRYSRHRRDILCSIMQSCIFLYFACVLFSRSVIISQKNAFVKSLRLIFSVFVFNRFVSFNFLPIE